MDDDILLMWLFVFTMFLVLVLGATTIYENKTEEETTTPRSIHYFNQPAQCFDGSAHRPCEFLEHEQDI